MALGTMFTTGGYRLGIPAVGGGAVWRGNEPASMTQLTDRAFNSTTVSYGPSEGTPPWYDNPSGNMDIATDAAAPQSASNVLRMIFPAAFAPGSSPCSNEFGTFGTEITQRYLYCCYYFKYSSNWQGNQDINKINYIYPNAGTASAVIAAIGSGSADMHLRIFVQGALAGGNFDSGATVVQDGTTVIPRDVWHLIEAVFVSNTGSNLDGSITLYLNGALETSYSGIEFWTGSPTWTKFMFQPVWGGGGISVTNEMYMYVDHCYLSQKAA